MMTLTTLRRLLPLALGILPCAFGYVVETYTSSDTPPKTVQVMRNDNKGIQYYLSNLVVAGATSSLSGATVITAGSNPTPAVQAAMASWNSVTTASVHFNALLPTSTPRDPKTADCKNVVTIGSSTDDLAVLGYVSAANKGAVAVTANQYVVGAGSVCGGAVSVDAGNLFDSDILLNPYFTFSTDGTANTVDLQAVVTHEFGHALGSNHSGILGSTMYPYSAQSQRYLSADDITFASATYPAAGTSTLGTMSGKITLSGNPVKFGLVTLIDQTAGKTLGTITAADGSYSLKVPAGSYIVYAEPFNSFVSPLNIYSLDNLKTGLLDPTQVTTGYEPTFLGTTNSPTAVPVTAGGTATANISVTAGTTTLTAPFYGIGGVGLTGDIKNVASIGNAMSLASGQSLEIGLTGGGVDATTSVLVFGRGISVKAGSIHVDPFGTFGGAPLLRTGLVIPAQTDVTLASLWIVKGTSILPISGGLVIAPVVPTISAIYDAESARPAITSGQWSAVYGTNLASTTRTWDPNKDFLGGAAAGSPLPPVLDGVSVTVNNVPASVYFVCATAVCPTNQINFLSPSNLPTSGTVNVVVSNYGTPSATFKATVAAASPSFFYYAAGGKVYPLAAHFTGHCSAPVSGACYVGDPAVSGNSYEKAHPGELILFYANGVAPSPGGAIVTAALIDSSKMTLSAGSTPLAISGAALLYAGEFQINATIPAGLASGDYTLSMTVPGGSTADAGLTVTLPVGP